MRTWASAAQDGCMFAMRRRVERAAHAIANLMPTPGRLLCDLALCLRLLAGPRVEFRARSTSSVSCLACFLVVCPYVLSAWLPACLFVCLLACLVARALFARLPHACLCPPMPLFSSWRATPPPRSSFSEPATWWHSSWRPLFAVRSSATSIMPSALLVCLPASFPRFPGVACPLASCLPRPSYAAVSQLEGHAAPS